jgi:UDP-galactopyranose mutase
MSRVAIIGAGFSGAVVAQELARAGHDVEVFESRNHVAGNCYSYKDHVTGVTIQKYGAHIFHTNNDRVWEYVRRFGEFAPYIHRVKANVGGKVYSLPINLHTINQFFGKDMSPAAAKLFINAGCYGYAHEPRNFEEQALSMIGGDLYEAFLKGYTEKQWGRPATEIPASILKRLPLRFDYNDNYFFHPHQGLPRNGYTEIVWGMLNERRIHTHLLTRVGSEIADKYDHTFYSGPLDGWFDYKFGRLPYRTIELVREEGVYPDILGCPVMNYCDATVPYTRRLEYRHFMPWHDYDQSVAYKEFSRECEPDDEPYYPVHLTGDNATVLSAYQRAAARHPNVTFIGRLGTFRYLDMDVTIGEALVAADKFLGRSS